MRAAAMCLVLAACPLLTEAADPEDVTFKARDGLVLTATYSPPAEPKAACVVLLHMLCGKRQDWNDLVPDLRKAGYAVLAIDMRGHGDSKAGGKVDMEELDDKKAEPICAQMAQDVAAAVAYLKGREEVDSTRIVLIGGSIGANVALNHAARDASVRSVVLLSPGLEYMGIKTKDAMKSCVKRPVLLVASSPDTESVKCVEALVNVAKGSKTVQSKIFDSKLTMGPNGQPLMPHGTGLLTAEKETIPLVLQWLADTAPAHLPAGGK